MLLKIYCSWFSAITTCSFDSLTDDKSLIKIKLNRSVNRVCFRMRSVTKKEEHGNTVWKYTVKSTLHCKWKYAVKSAIHGAWKQYRNYSINLMIPKYTDLCGGTRPDSHVVLLWSFHIVKVNIYFLLYHFINTSPRSMHSRLVGE